MLNNKTLIALSLIIIMFFSIKAQEEWTLEKCINYALENNIQIKQQQLNSELAKNSYKQSKIELFPNISSQVSYDFNSGRSVNYSDNSFTNEKMERSDFSLQSSLTLFNGFQNINNIKHNKLNLMASLQDLEKAKNDISLNIVAAYLDILFNKELVEVAESQLEVTKQQVDRTYKLVEAGTIAKGSLLEIQAQQATEELQLVNSKNRLDISYLKLTQLLKLKSTENFKIRAPQLTDVDAEKMNVSIRSVYSNAVSILPEIKSAEYKVKSSEK